MDMAQMGYWGETGGRAVSARHCPNRERNEFRFDTWSWVPVATFNGNADQVSVAGKSPQ